MKNQVWSHVLRGAEQCAKNTAKVVVVLYVHDRNGFDGATPHEQFLQ